MRSIVTAAPTPAPDLPPLVGKPVTTGAYLPLVARALLGVGAGVVAVAVLWHTLTFLMAHRPVLPIFDGWATWTNLNEVVEGRSTPFVALLGRHNEHRILLTRLLFLLDLLDGGHDRLPVAVSLAFQALQAGLWLVFLRQARVDRSMRWLVGGTVAGMLFTLRQGDNFISGFQTQFTGVFALNVVVAFMLVPRSPEAVARGMPSPCRVSAGMVGLLALPFVMANGLLAGPAYAMTGFASRSPGARRLACLALASTVFSLGLDRALPSDGVGTHLALTPTALLHAAAYLGGTVTSGRLPWAATAGFVGLSSTVFALGVTFQRGFRCRADTVALQAILFTAGSACATAVGRIGAGFGVEQALSGRYATGSAAFWSATLVFWAIRCQAIKPGPYRRGGLAALTAAAVTLLVFVVRDQHSYDRVLGEQSAATVRVLTALDRGTPPATSDLARIGVDLPTAQADVMLMRRIQAGYDIGHRTPRDERAGGERF